MSNGRKLVVLVLGALLCSALTVFVACGDDETEKNAAENMLKACEPYNTDNPQGFVVKTDLPYEEGTGACSGDLVCTQNACSRPCSRLDSEEDDASALKQGDCPDGSVCRYDVGGVCSKECNAEADCPAGWACAEETVTPLNQEKMADFPESIVLTVKSCRPPTDGTGAPPAGDDDDDDATPPADDDDDATPPADDDAAEEG